MPSARYLAVPLSLGCGPPDPAERTPPPLQGRPGGPDPRAGGAVQGGHAPEEGQPGHRRVPGHLRHRGSAALAQFLGGSFTDKPWEIVKNHDFPLKLMDFQEPWELVKIYDFPLIFH